MIPLALPVLLPTPTDAAEALPCPAFDLAARAAGLAEGARAANTRRAYAADWAHFTA